MRIFKDSSLIEEIQDLDLGIVSAGESKQFIFYVYNDSLASLINLEFSTASSEIKIIEAPKELKYKESEKLVLEYNPEVTLKQGLHAELFVKAQELYK